MPRPTRSGATIILKYDWCSYSQVDAKRLWPNEAERKAYGLEHLQRPYDLMGKHIAAQPRDIVYSLCQYGMGDVWRWGDSVGGQCWRTTNDITDTWKSMSDIGFHQDAAAPYAKPGNWNDPDMLIVGHVGWGNPHPTKLTTDEQYTHISLWCLLASPLLIGCDLEKLDDFTLSLLTNDEVLAVDQDALGKQATCVVSEGDLRVYAKEMEDGSRAVGFFNVGVEPLEIQFADFAKVGVSGAQTVRDLWRQKDIATLDAGRDKLPLTIPAHGVVLCKFRAAK
jgi:alpha-galactosidase